MVIYHGDVMITPLNAPYFIEFQVLLHIHRNLHVLLDVHVRRKNKHHQESRWKTPAFWSPKSHWRIGFHPLEEWYHHLQHPQSLTAGTWKWWLFQVRNLLLFRGLIFRWTKCKLENAKNDEGGNKRPRQIYVLSFMRFVWPGIFVYRAGKILTLQMIISILPKNGVLLSNS